LNTDSLNTHRTPASTTPAAPASGGLFGAKPATYVFPLRLPESRPFAYFRSIPPTSRSGLLLPSPLLHRGDSSEPSLPSQSPCFRVMLRSTRPFTELISLVLPFFVGRHRQLLHLEVSLALSLLRKSFTSLPLLRDSTLTFQSSQQLHRPSDLFPPRLWL
jgi:hypothetical protein